MVDVAGAGADDTLGKAAVVGMYGSDSTDSEVKDSSASYVCESGDSYAGVAECV